MNAYEVARQRYERAIAGCRAARERVTEANQGIDRAEDELAAAVRGLRQYETAPGIPLPEYLPVNTHPGPDFDRKAAA